MGRRAIAVMLGAVALGGCARACKNEHPYVPPEPTASSGADAATTGAALASAAADAAFGPTLEAPPGTTTINLDGVIVSMPDREIVLALLGDFDGDGKKDALAVVRPPAGAEGRGGTTSGELVHFRGGAPAPGVIAEGPTMSVDPSCTPTARLERIAPRAAFAEIGATCTKSTANRVVDVVRLGPAVAVAFEASVTDPAGAPKLAVAAESADRDKDGLDDVALTVTLEGPGAPFETGPRVSGKLAFFDRPAGPSRDSDEPEASLRALAGKSKDAASVPALVREMRALYRALCLEGGAPRIAPKIASAQAAAPACGTSKALEDAGVAAVRAWVTQGDALRAFAAADVASTSPATHTAARVTEVQKLLAEVAPPLEPKSSRSLNVSVDAAKAQPAWGALVFESNAKLLVRHGDKVSRVDLATWEQEDTDIAPWPAHVVSPDGKSRWIEAYDGCEGVALRATFAPVTEGDVGEVLLPVSPRLGAKCTGGRGEQAPAVPVAWTDRGLEAIVGGQPVVVRLDTKTASALASIDGEAAPRGSPRSPNGKAIAVPTSQGVLVHTDGKWTLRRAADFAPYSALAGCTTTDDGAIIACEKKGHVVVASF